MRALERLDSFPYRFRVGEAMSAPLVTARPDASLRASIRRMDETGVSSVLVAADDGDVLGIVTERDILRLLARHGPAVLDRPVSAVMTAPVHDIVADAFVHVAIGRMSRLGIRHLLVRDTAGRPVGMITARGLLRLRAGSTLRIGDAIAVAADAAALAAARSELPGVAAQLLAERMTAGEIAEVVSSVIRGLTARAAELAAAELAEAGRPPPAPWALLVLGSAGRGESLLSADQDNALVHAGRGSDDPWFAQFGERVNTILAAAGLSPCQGGVMASRSAWRHDLAGWRAVIEGWAREGEGESLLNVDIFYDFVPVAGEAALAAALDRAAFAVAQGSVLPQRLAVELERFRPPLGLFGRLPPSDRRLDLKLSGLYPLVAGARAIALKFGWAERSTRERLARAADAGILGEEDYLQFRDAHELLLRLILEQQLADLDAGGTAGTLVDLAGLTRAKRRMLKEALQIAGLITYTVRDVVAAG